MLIMSLILNLILIINIHQLENKLKLLQEGIKEILLEEVQK